jgi:hypothetical protein
MDRKIMAHVQVVTDNGSKIDLKTVELINNHCDFVTAAKLEGLMFQLNFGFFYKERPPVSSKLSCRKHRS